MLGDEIKEYRMKHLLTQQQMADKCEVSIVTIIKIENGKCSPSTLTLGKINKILKEEE